MCAPAGIAATVTASTIRLTLESEGSFGVLVCQTSQRSTTHTAASTSARQAHLDAGAVPVPWT